jgi:ankyrin repeat protein
MKEVFTYTTGEEMVDINLSHVMSPMHKAVDDNKFGLWCIYRLLGGEAAALNGHDKSSIQIINDSLKNNTDLLNNCNPIVQWLVKSTLKKYGPEALTSAVKLGDAILIQKLIVNGYDVHKIDKNGNTLLHTAVKNGQSKCARILIKEFILDVNAENESKSTALHLAAENGSRECMELLISNGAHLNAKNEFSKTPLHFAVEKEHLNSLQFLIEKGASLNVRDFAGKAVLHYAVNI